MANQQTKMKENPEPKFPPSPKRYRIKRIGDYGDFVGSGPHRQQVLLGLRPKGQVIGRGGRGIYGPFYGNVNIEDKFKGAFRFPKNNRSGG